MQYKTLTINSVRHLVVVQNVTEFWPICVKCVASFTPYIVFVIVSKSKQT